MPSDADLGLVKLAVMTNVFVNKQQHEIGNLNGSYSLNISSLDCSATTEINVFILHAKHEQLSLQEELNFQTKLW